MLESDLVVCKPNSSREMTISKQEQQVVLQQIFRKVRDHNEGKNGESLHPQRNVLYAAMLFLWLSSQDEAAIQKPLRLRVFLPQVDRKQLTRVYLLACHDLRGDLGQDRRKTCTNDEQLVQHRRSKHGRTISDIASHTDL